MSQKFEIITVSDCHSENIVTNVRMISFRLKALLGGFYQFGGMLVMFSTMLFFEGLHFRLTLPHRGSHT